MTAPNDPLTMERTNGQLVAASLLDATYDLAVQRGSNISNTAATFTHFSFVLAVACVATRTAPGGEAFITSAVLAGCAAITVAVVILAAFIWKSAAPCFLTSTKSFSELNLLYVFCSEHQAFQNRNRGMSDLLQTYCDRLKKRQTLLDWVTACVVIQAATLAVPAIAVMTNWPS